MEQHTFGPAKRSTPDTRRSGKAITANPRSGAGRRECLELINTMKTTGMTFLLGHKVRDMIAKGDFGVVELEFFQALAEQATGLRLASAPPAGIVYDDFDADDDIYVNALSSPRPKVEPGNAKVHPPLCAEDEGLRLIRMPEVLRLLGISRPTLYRLIQEGKFSAPIKQGRTSSWRRSAVLTYLANLNGSGL